VIELSLQPRSESRDRTEFATRFAEAQDRLRQGDYRTGLAPVAVGRRFAELPLPFPAEFWIATQARDKESAPLGRVCASISPHYRGLGYVGLFEAATSPEGIQAAAMLLGAAEDWLRDHGVKQVYGPVAFNTWFAYRFRVNAPASPTSPTYSWEPVNPLEYPAYFQAAGYHQAETYHSWAVPSMEPMIARLQPHATRARELGYSIRPFDAENLLEREVPILHRISMESFQSNFLFEPLPLELFRELYVPIAASKGKALDLSLSNFILDPQGKEVGFSFNFADLDPTAKVPVLVLKSIALSPEARGKGFSNALLHQTLVDAHARGLRQTISALAKKGIQSESYTKQETPLWDHEYALFRKELH
jgi:GNAT superfamily N-acetyltransferase